MLSLKQLGLDCGNYVWAPLTSCFHFFFLNDDDSCRYGNVEDYILRTTAPFSNGVACVILLFINICGVKAC